MLIAFQVEVCGKVRRWKDKADGGEQRNGMN